MQNVRRTGGLRERVPLAGSGSGSMINGYGFVLRAFLVKGGRGLLRIGRLMMNPLSKRSREKGAFIRGFYRGREP